MKSGPLYLNTMVINQNEIEVLILGFGVSIHIHKVSHLIGDSHFDQNRMPIVGTAVKTLASMLKPTFSAGPGWSFIICPFIASGAADREQNRINPHNFSIYSSDPFRKY